MDWSALEGVLRCQPGYELLHRVVLVLGGAASTASIIGAFYALWRWWRGPRHRRAARVLRQQGKYHARLNHPRQAMELYDLSIQLNPRAGHAYFLRGELHAKLGNTNQAGADWRRCLERLPSHRDARARVADQGRAAPWLWFQRPILLRVAGGVVVVSVVLIIGAMTPPGMALMEMALATVRSP